MVHVTVAVSTDVREELEETESLLPLGAMYHMNPNMASTMNHRSSLKVFMGSNYRKLFYKHVNYEIPWSPI